ncbi:protein FAM234B isoform X2 [Ornithorhynchus anatinus]|uniref:protein FAM234B isoform X2 n=1 Tax=Ornithorhynchus anatinus TaxID=9258 RepID=UPI0010A82107|nr:protein FAM234B isoform X2 [Ornithorhynchus anatinus]
MATVLSRALKLPGKKNPDLGEYDPLTQADSDESEDDLVLNLQQQQQQQQKNGSVKNGKSPLGEPADSDAEGGVAPKQPRLAEGPPEGYSPGPLGGLEPKASSSLGAYLRTSVFLLTVLVSVVLVLVCAFLVPCPRRDPRGTWTRLLGPPGDGALTVLELTDAGGDQLPDVLLSSSAAANLSAPGSSKPLAMLQAFSGLNGSTLWARTLPEEARGVQCSGPARPGASEGAVCIVTGMSKLLTTARATSGTAVWTLDPVQLANGTLAAPAASLPDVDGDGVGDLLVLTIGESQLDLCFLLVSGKTGTTVGRPVKYPIMGAGMLIGPQVHITPHGAIYILFGFGNVQAVALRDVLAQAQLGGRSPLALQLDEPEWEKRRATNRSEVIDIYSGGVEFLQAVKAAETNCSHLLVTTKQGVSLLHGEDLGILWTLDLPDISSQPTPGYFTDDQTPDFLLQAQRGEGVKKDVPEGGPGLQHLYLLHPAFPSVLLDLTNVTGTVTASTVGTVDVRKDAFFVTSSTAPRSAGRPGSLGIRSLSLRGALAGGRMAALPDTTPPPGLRPRGPAEASPLQAQVRPLRSQVLTWWRIQFGAGPTAPGTDPPGRKWLSGKCGRTRMEGGPGSPCPSRSDLPPTPRVQSSPEGWGAAPALCPPPLTPLPAEATDSKVKAGS